MPEHEILYLIKERIRVLSLLKEIYLKKQKLVFSGETEENERLDEHHKIFIAEMLALEEKWRTFIHNLKSDKKIDSDNTDIILSLALHDDWVTQYFAYKDKLYQILSEIERIKKNSHLMASNEFPYLLNKDRVTSKSQQKNLNRPKQNRLFLDKKSGSSKKIS